MLADYRAGLNDKDRGYFDRARDKPFARFLMWTAHNSGRDALSAFFTNYASSDTPWRVAKLTAKGVRVPVEYYYHYIDAMDDAMNMCDEEWHIRRELERFTGAWDKNQALPDSAIAPLDPAVPTDRFVEPGSVDFSYVFTDYI